MTDTLKSFTDIARKWIMPDMEDPGMKSLEDALEKLLEDYRDAAANSVFLAVGHAQEDLYRTMQVWLEPSADGLNVAVDFENYEEIPARQFDLFEAIKLYCDIYEPTEEAIQRLEATIGALEKAVNSMKAKASK